MVGTCPSPETGVLLIVPILGVKIHDPFVGAGACAYHEIGSTHATNVSITCLCYVRGEQIVSINVVKHCPDNTADNL